MLLFGVVLLAKTLLDLFGNKDIYSLILKTIEKPLIKLIYIEHRKIKHLF